MKPIVVQDQVRLGWMRCLRLTLTGMSYRMFRSAVTVFIFALAVAFVAHMLGFGLLAGDTRAAAAAELRGRRLLGEWVRRLSEPDSEAVVEAAFVGGETARLTEYARWGGLSGEEMALAVRWAQQQRAVAAYLGRLSPTARVALCPQPDWRVALDGLAEPEAFALFQKRVGELKLQPPLGKWEVFAELVREGRPAWRALVERIRQGQAAAIEAVRRSVGGVPASVLLVSAPVDLREALRQAGFEMDEATLRQLAQLATEAQDLDRLGVVVEMPEVKAALARHLGQPREEVSLPAVLRWVVAKPGRAAVVYGLIREQPAARELTVQRVEHLARQYVRQATLQRVAGELVAERAAGGGLKALPRELLWLIAVSFLLCAVGVANAMFMSVTERFAEIATMKCLGALDGFILQMFVFEALLQGLVGGLIGVMLGMALALVRGGVEFGGLMWDALNAGELALGGLAALAVGMVVAMVAAMGPALVAARLAPMEAMRVE